MIRVTGPVPVPAPDPAQSPRPFESPRPSDEERMCWICLGGDEELPARIDWLHPCRCRGSNKWVHRGCLNRWIDEKQLHDPEMPMACTQCRTKYIIVTPPLNAFDAFLDQIDQLYETVCPSVMMGTLSAGLYFAAMTFGALTLIQVFGYRVSLTLLRDEPTVLMIVLPTIPAVLLLLRNLRWDDHLTIMWRGLRGPRPVAPREDLDEDGEIPPGAPLDEEYFDGGPPDQLGMNFLDQGAIFGDEGIGSTSASFIVALSLPSFAVLLGHTLFSKMGNRLLAIVMGGVTFLGIKGLSRAYLRHSTMQRKRGRSVLDYTPLNVENYISLRGSGSRNIPDTR
ncbi:GL20188 [Drosophila persimilis]|uniref:E3 ubiquitin-protein ligase MARCHF5 n=1 Tax=Drosophila persimilis TaxID=7234 RepID=B4GXX0_DROPE|nr:E3 ubiquitin-protein ligase MARCH5 [Drosophila persimilis]EDW27597.1 GL20188 [Drosophila persimilis]